MTTLVAPAAASPTTRTPLDPRPASPHLPHVTWLVRTGASQAPAVGRRATVVVLSGCDATRLARSVALAAAGLRVHAVATLQAARAAAVPGVGCLVLDRRAPDGDALALVDELYRTEGAPRIVVVTTEESERERVESLVAGADDVVPPHVLPSELVARVGRLAAAPTLTSAPRCEATSIAIGRVSIDRDRRCVRVDGSEVALSPTQYQILVSLAVEHGRSVTVRTLVERCWDRAQEQSSCAVRTQVTRLRRALRGAIEIRCVRGEGYRLAEAGD